MRRIVALCAVYVAFAMPIAMLGVAWPDIRELLARSEGELGVLAGCYGVGRLAMAASSGTVLRRLAFGPAMLASALVLAVSSLAVAAAPRWPALVAAVGVIGLASGSLESLGSRFLALAGSVRTAGLVAGCYGVGATVGPALVAWSGRWQLAYAASAVVTVAAGALFAAPAVRHLDGMVPARPDPDRASAATTPGAVGAARSTPGGVQGAASGAVPPGSTCGAVPPGAVPPVSMPEGEAGTSPAADAGGAPDRFAVVVSLSMFVAFVGIEVTAGQWTATLLEQARGLDRQAAGLAVSGFFAGITVGRLLMGAVALPLRALQVLALALVPLLTLVAFGPARTAPVAVILAGLALAPMFPAMMATTGQRVGAARAGRVSGWQLLAGNTGATVLPALTGLLVALTGPMAAALVLIALAVVGAVCGVLSIRPVRGETRPEPAGM